MKHPVILILTLALTACGTTTQIHMQNQKSAMEVASKLTEKNCGNWTFKNPPPKGSAVAFIECKNTIQRERVLPVAAFPEKYEAILDAESKNAILYDHGKLSAEKWRDDVRKRMISYIELAKTQIANEQAAQEQARAQYEAEAQAQRELEAQRAHELALARELSRGQQPSIYDEWTRGTRQKTSYETRCFQIRDMVKCQTE